MKIDSLIEDYKKQTNICFNTNYSEKDSINKHNKAISKMMMIIDLVNNHQDITKFYDLLNDKEHKTNLWVSIHLIEKTKLDKKNKEKALKIISKYSKGNDSEAMGLREWLKEHKSNKFDLK